MASCNRHRQVMTFQAFRRIGCLITIELDQSYADPIQQCVHSADHRIALSCHPCVDRPGSRSILRLHTAKDAGAAKGTQRQSLGSSTDSSSGQISAQSESSTQYPCTEEHNEQDVERPYGQLMLASSTRHKAFRHACRCDPVIGHNQSPQHQIQWLVCSTSMRISRKMAGVMVEYLPDSREQLS